MNGLIVVDAAVALLVASGSVWVSTVRYDCGRLEGSGELHRAIRRLEGIGICAAAVVWCTISGLLAVVAMSSDINGSRIIAAVPLLGACAGLAVQVVGELTWRPIRTQVRSAHLQRRGVTEIVQPGALSLALAGGTALFCIVVWGGVTADASQRRLAVPGVPAWARPAFPGWFYGTPQLAGLAALALLTSAVVASALLRPAAFSADPAADSRLRRGSCARAMRISTLGVLSCVFGDAFIAVHALRERGADQGAQILIEILSGALLMTGIVLGGLLMAPMARYAWRRVRATHPRSRNTTTV